MKRNWLSLVVIVAVALSVWGGLPHTALAADGDIVISEVMFNSFCESANGTSTACEGGSIETQYEWVEIYNRGTTPVDIANWQICDSAGCDTITTASTLIGPNQYWLIATNSTAVQVEMGAAPGGNYGTYNGSRTIFLTSSIGSNGLSNTSDAVYLRTSTGGPATDCISYASTALTACSGLTYVAGGTGFDSTLASETDGQSITNIQGTWAYHNLNGGGSASPYSSNTASGGSPSAVTLNDFAASTTASPAPIILGGLGVAAAALLLRRKLTRPAPQN